MDKKTMESLRVMLCEEIESIAKKGNLTHESLDILKDLIETEKNLGKIEHYDKEKEESMALAMPGYSQRKFYIDADYEPRGGMSYGMGSYMDGNSYAGGGRTVYDIDRNSYMYYGPGYEPMPTYSMAMGNSYARGYSRHGDTQEMKKELNEMMNETQDVKVKDAIQKVLNEMNK